MNDTVRKTLADIRKGFDALDELIDIALEASNRGETGPPIPADGVDRNDPSFRVYSEYWEETDANLLAEGAYDYMLHVVSQWTITTPDGVTETGSYRHVRMIMEAIARRYDEQLTETLGRPRTRKARGDAPPDDKAK